MTRKLPRHLFFPKMAVNSKVAADPLFFQRFSPVPLKVPPDVRYSDSVSFGSTSFKYYSPTRAKQTNARKLPLVEEDAGAKFDTFRVVLFAVAKLKHNPVSYDSNFQVSPWQVLDLIEDQSFERNEGVSCHLIF